jgi:hypothetical protein
LGRQFAVDLPAHRLVRCEVLLDTERIQFYRLRHATSGRYQPLGGGAVRGRCWLSKRPRRSNMRLIVLTDGGRAGKGCKVGQAGKVGNGWDKAPAAPAASIASRIATAPYSPRALSLRRRMRQASTSSSTLCGVRRGEAFGPSGRSDQSTESSRSSPACWAQRRTVSRLTWNRRATARRLSPARTAATISRRFASLTSLFCQFAVSCTAFGTMLLNASYWHSGER